MTRRRELDRPSFLSARLSVACWLALAQISAPVKADPPQPSAGPIDFARDVRPIFQSRCLGCHGPGKQKGGLRLDRRADAFAGGDSGRAIEPGKSAESLLITNVASLDPSTVMPPKGQRLTGEEIGRLRAWIDQGAPWPDVPTTGHSNADASARAGHWSFRAVTHVAPPAVKTRGWADNPLDAFILARLEAEGVTPSAEADLPTLIRRLKLDLLGLPPTPAEVEAFVNDRHPEAYLNLVDRFLGSPHFGERWGRHWLDLARYADSDGYEKDAPRPNAWRFRDWVIQAINRDLPFDEFTVAQIAGDLVPDTDLWTKTGTGFHRNTLTNTEGGADKEEFRVKAVVDRVNTTGTVWLGLTVGCAQCHSHKYDPLSQKEYYSLFAFFNSGKEDEVPVPSGLAETPPVNGKGGGKTKPSPAIAVLVENPDAPRTHILIRGDFLRKGDETLPGTPAVLPVLEPEGKLATRLDLARWLVAPENPLTPRVAANRVWHHLFGRGLVATLDDFGTRGESPSHPELLDWLAQEFMARGWSPKRLIKSIVTSSTYRQASATRPELAGRDPNNHWLARQNRLRLEAETLRDAALSCGGLLTPVVGGPSVRPPQPPGIAELTYAGSARWVDSKGPDRYRRGLYTWFQRTSPYPMLTTFDAPDANVCAVKRERSNTPLQALTLLNDASFFECAQALGHRVLAETSGGTEDRLGRLYMLCLSRHPSAEERAELTRLYSNSVAFFHVERDQASLLIGHSEPGIDSAEVAAWVVLARTVLNLDEFVTRE